MGQIGPREAMLRAQREARAEAAKKPRKPANAKAASGPKPAAPQGRVPKANSVEPQPQVAVREDVSRGAGTIVVGATSSVDPRAKATRGKSGTAGVKGPVRRSTAGTGLRVGVADADQPQRGRGRPKIDGPREWEKQGISRAEWYRRQKDKAK